VRKSTKEEFKEKSNITHNAKYDYSLSVYTNSSTKIKILCPEHGVFEQTPNSHIMGSGCSKCSGNAKKTNSQFVIEAKSKHGNKYDYSLVKYKNANKGVDINCYKHGIFKQNPSNHLRGEGCPLCGNDKTRLKNRESLDSFIRRAKLKHGDNYDYSLVEYKNNKTKVLINCPKHGVFEQLPYSHLIGSDCTKCGVEKAKKSRTKTNSRFIDEAKLIHEGKYDYSLVEYTNTDIKVKIICPKHEAFKQKPTKHLQNQGCPVCRESKLEKEVRNLLLKNKIKFNSQHGRKNDDLFLSGQTVDFYLPEHKIAIECQGIQHFEPIDFGNKGSVYSSERFRINLMSDHKKYLMCNKKGVDVVYYTRKHKYVNKEYIGELFSDKKELLNRIKNKDEK